MVAVLELHTATRVTSVCFVAVNAVAAVVLDGRVWARSDPGANMEFTDYMLLKMGVLCALAFIAGLFGLLPD